MSVVASRTGKTPVSGNFLMPEPAVIGFSKPASAVDGLLTPDSVVRGFLRPIDASAVEGRLLVLRESSDISLVALSRGVTLLKPESTVLGRLVGVFLILN
jgi:hypothetical protein